MNMAHNGMKIAPSILSADLAHLARDLERVSNADYIHIDVMDGHFTGNLTFGAGVVAAAKRVTGVPLDVHMMVSNPEDTIQWYVDAGADMVTVHYEASTHLHRIITRLKDSGVKAGVVLNPATPVSVLDSILDDLDLVLVMSVDPGFGGQSYIPSTDRKLSLLRDMIEERGSGCMVEVDGGVNAGNAGRIAAAGADILVAGSAVFGDDDPAAAIDRLREAADAGAARHAE